jgi:hypothetical protein
VGRLDGQGNLLPPGEIKTPGEAGMRTGMLALTATNRSSLAAWKKDGWMSWQLTKPLRIQAVSAVSLSVTTGAPRNRAGHAAMLDALVAATFASAIGCMARAVWAGRRHFFKNPH